MTHGGTASIRWIIRSRSSRFSGYARENCLSHARPPIRLCIFLLASLVLLAMTGLNLFALAALSPVLIRSFWYLANPVRQNNLQRVGWLEMIYSIVFLIFITLTFRV